jgi:hypothetical protein
VSGNTWNLTRKKTTDSQAPQTEHSRTNETDEPATEMSSREASATANAPTYEHKTNESINNDKTKQPANRQKT